jgi:biofilm PGA synthesis N-glycosyltransferase PgaC
MSESVAEPVSESGPGPVSEPRGYALVTPARDERENLERLAGSILAQTVVPDAWVIVDDGSVDGTLELAEALAGAHPWIRSIASPGPETHGGALSRGRGSGRDVIAFNAGIATLPRPSDLVLKLDADVSLDPDYFERLFAVFAADPALGIAGGVCLELEEGRWVPQRVTGDHVRGAVRAYRWPCFTAVTPLVERLGWDGIDEIKARTLGWRTRSLPELPFRHHRPLGSRDGRRRAWAGQGEAAFYMGYRPSYLLLRSLHHMRRDRAAAAMAAAYVGSWLRRRPRHHDEAVVRRLRAEQRDSLRAALPLSRRPSR